MNKSVLHWSYRNFQNIPEALLEYDEFLEEVYLKENFIVSIPKWLLQLINLKFIHLSGNLITEIPDEIYFLENLEFLDLSNNKLKSIPDTIGKLKSLERLNIGGNDIVVLPKAIGKLKNLEMLDVSANLIHLLPGEIANCQKLNDVVLCDNINLKLLPNKIMNLPELESICADRCGLLYLPAILSPSVTHVRLFNNRFITHVPMSYLVHIRRFYDIVHLNEQRYIDTSKYFVVKEKESDRKLLLPNDVRNIHYVNLSKVFSLFDLCLKAIDQTDIKESRLESIPEILRAYITRGASALCSSEDCHKKLYTEYYFLVVKRLNSSSNLIFSCTFCTLDCANKWLKANDTEYYSIDWEVL